MIIRENKRLYSSQEGMLVLNKQSGEARLSWTGYLLPSDQYEEITAQDYKDRLSQAKEQKEYDTSVESLIRLRYSLSEEIALINNFNAIATLSDADSDKAERYATEYGQYQAYRAACKVKAREQIEARKEAERLAEENRLIAEGDQNDPGSQDNASEGE